MSTHITSGEYGYANMKTLAKMGNSNAQLFYHLTLAIAEHYGVPSGIELGGFDNYSLEESSFCHLVEAVFAAPSDLARTWAEYAAAMYEGIKRERYYWVWHEESKATPLIRPYYYAVDNSLEWGRYWIPTLKSLVQDFSFETNSSKIVGRLDQRQANLFIAMANVVTQEQQASSGLSYASKEVCRIDEQIFCDLVEQVVSNSPAWFYSWAEYAAGMYEVVKGEWYAWVWDASRGQINSFCPMRQPEFFPSQPSGKTVAFQGWEFWQRRQAEQIKQTEEVASQSET